MKTRAGMALFATGALVVGTSALAGAQSPAASGGATQVAYLSASSANTWLQVSKTEMDKIAAENGITITEFDGQFNPDTQGAQLQDAIASGQYKGMIVAALNGEGLLPDLQKAAADGVKIVALNQIIGPALDTADPQDPAIVASVLAPPLRSGQRLGEITLKACEGIDPCNVVYFYGIKGIPLDNALEQGFNETIAKNPAIKVVNTGEGQYLGPDVAMTAMQDIITATPDFNVVVGSDQSIQGVLLALQDAGKTDVKLIGLGGSTPAIQGIKDGTWFGDVMGAPGTEGKLAMQALVQALTDGTAAGGIDPLTTLPDEGLITADNVDKFTAEWNG
ncbi:MAG: sugar ABC transporter substrate-binding protein [Chloroflexota bacterium]